MTRAAEAAPLDLGIVIVSYNTRDLLAACLTCLKGALDASGLKAETLVVDNASADGSAAMVARDFPWVRLHDGGQNLGFTVANNLALRSLLARGAAAPAWILLLNPDTEVRPGALEGLLAAVRLDPAVAVAGPSLEYADGRFQHAAFRYPGVLQAALDLFPPPGVWGARLLEGRLNGRYPRQHYAAGRPFAVDFVLGACLLVRTTALREVGLLDEGYFMYAEEVDWCRRFTAAGWRCLCVPAARILHHGGAASGQFRAWSWATLWQSRRRYLRRFEPAWRCAAVEGLLRLAIARRRRADRRLLAAGRLDAFEAGEREEAYVRALEPLPSPDRVSPDFVGLSTSPAPSRVGGESRGEMARDLGEATDDPMAGAERPEDAGP